MKICVVIGLMASLSTCSGLQVYSAPLDGIERIQVVTCVAATTDPDIASIAIFDPRNDTALVIINLRTLQCIAGAIFTSCDLAQARDRLTLKAIINDLEEGEERRYGCKVLRVNGGTVLTTRLYVNVTYTARSTTTTAATSITAVTTAPVTTTTLVGGRNSRDNDNSDDDREWKLAAMVGGITGGVVIVIIVALVIVIVKNRCDPLYAIPRLSGRNEEDHTYTELGHLQQTTPPAPVTSQNTNSTTERSVREDRSAGTAQSSSAEPHYEHTTAGILQTSSVEQIENTDGNVQQPPADDGDYEIPVTNR